MRLFDPSIGEIADRMTILELKIAAAKTKEKPHTHWKKEYDECEAALDAKTTIFVEEAKIKMEKFYSDLRIVNTKLWDLEDRIRVYVGREVLGNTFNDAEKEDIILIALQIPYFNDRRAHLVGDLNALEGKDTGTEKLYT